jgi:hypothetical protein
MAAAPRGALFFSVKDQVLSGGAARADHPATRFREKPWVLSGEGPGPQMPGEIYPDRHRDFAGWRAGHAPACPVPLPA